MSDRKDGGGLFPPAVAKWHFVEEKARAVLDAHCHREVRLPPEIAVRNAAGLPPEAGALVRLAAAHAARADAHDVDAVTRWYSLGPGDAAQPAAAGGNRRVITAVIFGPGGASVEAEQCAMAVALVREAGVPAAALRIAVTGGAAVVPLLEALGESNVVAAADPGAPGLAFTIAVARAGQHAQPLCQGFRHDGLVAALGGPSVALTGFTLDLDAMVAAVTDEDEGYLPTVSLLVAPAAPDAVPHALALAQRLRAAGIRTELEHRPADADVQAARAAAHDARLCLTVTAGVTNHVLGDLATGQRHQVADADLELRVAQLLD